MVKVVIFDFGGVIAEEGFREGLLAIANSNGIDPEYFLKKAEELIFKTGYVTGKADESHYWDVLRRETKIKQSDKELREEILNRFVIKKSMIENVKNLKSSGFVVAILSDQTNWLDEINEKTPFLNYFDHIYNSYRIKKSKKDPALFKDVCMDMGFDTDDVLFVDDRIENIINASGEGLKTIHFKDELVFRKEIAKFINI